MVPTMIALQEAQRNPGEAPTAPLNSALVASIEAGNHIHYAAGIIADAMPRIPERDHQFFDSITGALCMLEGYLTEMNHIRENRREQL